MASPLRLPAGLITLLAGPLHPTTSATVMPNLCLLCGSYSRLGYSGRCQAPGWSMHLQETYTAWWMASSDEIGQGIRKRGQGGHSCYAAPRRQSWQASPGDTCSKTSVWLVYHIEHTAAFTRRRRPRVQRLRDSVAVPEVRAPTLHRRVYAGTGGERPPDPDLSGRAGGGSEGAAAPPALMYSWSAPPLGASTQPSSARKPSDRPTAANLAHVYGNRWGTLTMPPMEVIFTMCPLRRARI